LSTVTRVFVVLLAVFSIAFTVMTVSIVSQTANWRDTSEKYQEHARVADTNLRSLIAANAADMAAARDAVRDHLDRIGEVETQLQSAKNEVGQLRSELAKAASEKSGAEAINRGLLAQLQVAESGRAEYQKQRDDLEKQSIDLQRRNIDLNDRVNEQTARIVVFLEQKRQYDQQLNILKSENEKLSRQTRTTSIGSSQEHPAGAAMSNVSAVTPVAATRIRGKVLEISGKIVTVSVGSTDGVEKGMVFIIHRESEYVGDLEISLVDPNQSAGRMVRSTVAPQAGDEVTDRLGSPG